MGHAIHHVWRAVRYILYNVRMARHLINISVRTTYVDAQSEPEASRYVFAYTVTITNTGDIAAKLLTRHWIIRDANNKVQEVRGAGVVGEQPYLEPGMSFEYTSGTMLETPLGEMRGSYQMIADDGVEFDAEIPAFVLTTPRTLH
jgi:ApaG protein